MNLIKIYLSNINHQLYKYHFYDLPTINIVIHFDSIKTKQLYAS